ncbi:hypothetical protein NDN16_05150 [Aureimonas altamirensis]|uniref:hypothetical protein n=1 Tax=Aureimonas altamirensis TaxID=370622 RepID=UPI002036BDF0|nr:hypothetical protein [Aureimonas altamirensis]MCM2503063.1 hypothetical protein [Aureimonas altamirensis]
MINLAKNGALGLTVLIMATQTAVAQQSIRDQAVFLFSEESSAVAAIDWVQGKRDALVGTVENVRSGWIETGDPKRLTYRLSPREAECIKRASSCSGRYSDLVDAMSGDLERRGIVDRVREAADTAKNFVRRAGESVTEENVYPNRFQRSAMLGARLESLREPITQGETLADQYAQGVPGTIDSSTPEAREQLLSEYGWQASQEITKDEGVLYGMPDPEELARAQRAAPEAYRIEYTSDGTRWQVYDYQGTDSSVTIDGAYEPVTKQYAQETFDTYGTIPGGISCVSENSALPAASEALLVYSGNQLILIENKLRYSVPIPAPEFVDLVAAVAKDDRLAVSLTSNNGTAIGGLPIFHRLTQELLNADSVLGSLVFGGSASPLGYRFEDADMSLNAKRPFGFTGAVFFEVRHKGFSINEGTIVSLGQTMRVTLVPLKENHTEGSVPDLALIEDGFDLSGPYAENAKEIASSIGMLSQDPALIGAFHICEAAALARQLKSMSIGVDKMLIVNAVE